MKVVVAGSRDFLDYDLVQKLLSNYEITEIVCGEARGADEQGKKYAKLNNIQLTSFPADWDTYGKRAGHLRNEQMALYCDFAVIFWDGYSRGTYNMITNMKKLGKNCKIVKYNDDTIPDLDEGW